MCCKYEFKKKTTNYSILYYIRQSVAHETSVRTAQHIHTIIALRAAAAGEKYIPLK